MSEVKTAKVTEILGCKPWNGPNGTIYFHKIELDNGDIGEIGKKKENAFNIGDSVTYTAEQTEYGLKLKAVQQNGFGGGGKSQGSPASFCLSYAKDVCVAMIPAHPEKTPTEWVATITAMADKFNVWLRANQ